MPYTLLLADDSVTIQRVIELTFADEDVTVVAVSDGDQAIERMEASPPDIVLADIGMPGKNGYEVAQYMRQSPKLAHIPVVLLTGAFEPVDQARANEAGCDGVLAKPFEPQLVIGRVKELLARSRRAPQGAPAAAVKPDDQSAAAQPRQKTTVPAADNIWAPPPPAESRTITPFLEPPTAAPAAAASTAPAPRSELNDYFDRLDAAFSTLSSAPPAKSAPPIQTVPDPPAAPIDDDLDWFDAKKSETGSAEPWDMPAPSTVTAADDLPLSYASPETVFDLIEPQAGREEPVSPPVTLDAPDERLAPIEESAPVDEPEPIAAIAPIDETAALEEPPAIDEPAPLAPAPAAPLDELADAAPEPAAPIMAAAAVAPPSAPAPTAAAPRLEIPLPNPPPLPSLPDAFAALLAAEQGEPLSAGTGLWPAAGPAMPSAPSAPAPAVVTDEILDDIVRRVLDRLSDTVVRDAVTDVASKVAERLIREEIERIRASIR